MLDTDATKATLGERGRVITESWRIFRHRDVTRMPQQTNGVDCGMFAFHYARCIIGGIPFDFTQGDIPAFRRRLLLDAVLWERTADEFLSSTSDVTAAASAAAAHLPHAGAVPPAPAVAVHHARGRVSSATGGSAAAGVGVPSHRRPTVSSSSRAAAAVALVSCCAYGWRG